MLVPLDPHNQGIETRTPKVEDLPKEAQEMKNSPPKGKSSARILIFCTRVPNANPRGFLGVAVWSLNTVLVKYVKTLKHGFDSEDLRRK